jgi:hypothetical protein
VTSFKQIEANRRNARRSTGPTSEAGKERSRRNAVRHGLTAETVVEPVEDAEDYRAFEMSVTAEFDAQTAVERELVLRLASLLWRLRRATAIEAGLLQMRVTDDGQQAKQNISPTTDAVLSVLEPLSGVDLSAGSGPDYADNGSVELAFRFLHVARFDGGAFERLNRYETALWRQAAQLLFALNFLHRPSRRPSTFPIRRDNLFPFGSRR